MQAKPAEIVVFISLKTSSREMSKERNTADTTRNQARDLRLSN